ncbi:SGNH/GDSL hydrolase family protein [Stenotrophomonas sp.]|uniref:SGNH/GDSL hydrolase family protein n=1 Tax=Stenotrophomonas sp. TaxID=69392 RepID=UPI0028A6C0B0|nr:SGNH/GDSL hydrolase family protein [Stenotrophomonas sp.]
MARIIGLGFQGQVMRFITAFALSFFQLGFSVDAFGVGVSRPILIEVYGDSTTLGAQTASGSTVITMESEPKQLQGLLRERFGDAVTVVNKGVGGTQAYQLLSGTDGMNRPWPEQIANSDADIVILNYALNDQLYNAKPAEGVFQGTPESYGEIMALLVQIARDQRKVVVLQEPNPTCHQPRVGNLHRFVEALRSTAKRVDVPLVAQYDFLQGIPNWKDLLSDCVHPGDQLYGIKAKQTFEVVAPIVDAIR